MFHAHQVHAGFFVHHFEERSLQAGAPVGVQQRVNPQEFQASEQNQAIHAQQPRIIGCLEHRVKTVKDRAITIIRISQCVGGCPQNQEHHQAQQRSRTCQAADLLAGHSLGQITAPAGADWRRGRFPGCHERLRAPNLSGTMALRPRKWSDCSRYGTKTEPVRRPWVGHKPFKLRQNWTMFRRLGGLKTPLEANPGRKHPICRTESPWLNGGGRIAPCI